MTPLSKKAFWILLTIVIVSVVSIYFYEWANVIIAAGCLVSIILLGKPDLLNKIFFFSIPLSIEINGLGIGDIIFPSELIAVLVACIVIFTALYYRTLWRTPAFHPASWSLLLLWLALVLGTLTTNMPLISIKSLTIFTLYLIVFYLQWFLYKEKASVKIQQAIKYYFAGLLVVCLITFVKHAMYGFLRSKAMYVPSPFYSDHTIYGTCLAFFIPMLYYWIKTATSTLKYIYSLALALFLFTIFNTYSRAVWMSLIVVLIVYYMLKIKVDIKKLTVGLVFVLLLFLVFQEPMINYMSENRSDSKSRKAELTDQLKSVTNISTDVSNLERINRWKSALSMFNEKPLTGHGPGTYQFNFISYQKTADKTPISVSHASDHFSQGMGGTAHSQYLLYASESGVLALFAFLACILFTINEAFNLYYNSTDVRERLYIKALLGGYITFVFHSFFNNFLDVDKSASLFLVFNAGIIILSLEKRFYNNSTK